MLLASVMMLALISCDDTLEIENPTDALSAEQVFSTVEGIEAAEIGLYTGTYHSLPHFYQYYEIYYPMFADEMTYRLNSYAEYYANTYSPSSSMAQNLWYYPYQSIYRSNDFLTRIQGTTLISDQKYRMYQAEARYLRAYSYIFLVNTFGGVPIITTNDYKEAATVARSSKEEVWNLIIEDLTFAKENLKDCGNPKTRITSYAASALLARAYLYNERWQEAADEASEMIPVSDGGLGQGGFSLETVDRVFKYNSSEAICQFNTEGFTGSGTYVGYTRAGILYIPTTSRVNYRLTESLVNDIKSDTADQRIAWIDSVVDGSSTWYYPYKYKNNQTPSSADDYEYYVYTRLAEMYLIRAEANAHLGNLQPAICDLNAIRRRAGISDLPLQLTSSEILYAVEEERRKELFCEQGHRWADLNRTGRADAIYGALSYKSWESHRSLLPISEKEILKNPYLEQNPGY